MKLPAILPIVLYNGSKPWDASLKLSDLFQPVPDSLKSFQPAFEYYLIDINRFISQLPDKTSKNLAELMFRLEFNHGLDDFTGVLQTIIDVTADKQFSEVRRIINSWINEVFLPRQAQGTDVALPTIIAGYR